MTATGYENMLEFEEYEVPSEILDIDHQDNGYEWTLSSVNGDTSSDQLQSKFLDWQSFLLIVVIGPTTHDHILYPSPGPLPRIYKLQHNCP